MEIRRKAGYRTKTASSIIHEEIQRVSVDGAITPEALVDASRPEDAPLHPEFTWDDWEAAEKYRQQEARCVLRSIEVISPRVPPAPLMLKVEQIVDAEPPKTVYRETTEVMSNPELRAEVLANAIKELAALRKKYSMLSELAKVYAAMDDLLGDEGAVAG